MMAVAVALLTMQVVADEPAALRLVATVAESENVVWRVNGIWVGTTTGREALVIPVGAGHHRVEAHGSAAAPWIAAAWLVPDGADVRYVHATWASAEGLDARPIAWPAWGAVALVAVARRKAKGP